MAKKMKWLLVTSHKKAYGPQRMIEEIEKRGDEVVVAEYYEVDIHIKTDEVSITVSGQPLESFDGFVFRTPTKSAFDHLNFHPVRHLMVEHLHRLGKKKIVNADLLRLNVQGMNKLTQMFLLAQNGLPVVPSQLFGYYDSALRQEWQWPMIAKAIVGSHGSAVKKIEDERDVKFNLAAYYPWKLLFQPFLPTGEDYRVLVLGGKVLGAMKRIAKEGEFLTNVSAGGSFEQAPVTTEMKRLALKAAKTFKAEYCGVDIMYDEAGKPFVLEVNDGAQFEGFEKCTSMNVAKQLVEYVAGKS